MRSVPAALCFLVAGILLVLPSMAPTQVMWQRQAAMGASYQDNASDEATKEENRKEIQHLKALHRAIVDAINAGKSLDDIVPNKTLKSITGNAGYGMNSDFYMNLESSAENRDGVTYRDLLKADEKLMVLKNVDKVTVQIDAQPQHCQVDYVEVASSARRSFGQTKASMKLDPKLYDFVCECLGTPHHAMLDCTSDQSYTFDCGEPEKR